MPGTPPLLNKLLELCTPLSQETQDDIIDAFYREYDSRLYCDIRPRLTDVPTHEAYDKSEFFQAENEIPVVIASSLGADVSKAEIHFNIPRFLNRLLADKEVSLAFLVLGGRSNLCRSKITVKNTLTS